MHRANNFSYYLSIAILTFGVSFLLAMKAAFLKTKISFRLKTVNKLVWLLIIIYCASFSILAILKYNAYNAGIVDLGRISQAVWNTLQGRFLVGTFEFGNACRMIAHIELIYVLIAPLYLFFSDPKMLLILQTAVISFGALPIYWLAKKNLNSNFVSFCFSFAYLLNPSLQYANLSDFHPDMLALTFLLFTFYYLEEKTWIKYFIFLILSLLCKEYISLILIMLGIYIILRHKNFKIASLTILLGLFWFFLTYKIIPGILRQGKENLMISYYAHLGSSISGVFRTIILHPVATIAGSISLEKLANLILLLLPVGFLTLFNLSTFFISLPILVGLILSPMFSYANHHNGTIIPFIFISAIGGSQYLIRRLNPKFKNITFALGIFVFSNSLFSSVFYGPSPLSWRFWDKSSYAYGNSIQHFKITEHDKIADRYIKMVPQGAKISVSNHLGAHLSKRQVLYHFPHPGVFKDIDYVLVDLLEYAPVFWNPREDEINMLRRLFLNKNFTLLSWQDGMLLFHKRLRDKENYHMNVSLVKKAEPVFSVNRSFGNRILLLGYDLDYDGFQAGKKYRYVYYWQVLEEFDKDFYYDYFGNIENLTRDYILIDTFENGPYRLRVVHLPTYILYSPRKWKAGDIIKEEFEFYLPEDLPLGSYNWKIGLYVVPKFFFIKTEPKNLVPQTAEIKLGTIKINKER